MLLLALSSLQGRGQTEAFHELARYGTDGIQLTPGNLPDADFLDVVADTDLDIRFHHGFAWGARGRRVYDDALRPIGIGVRHSVHPPTTDERRDAPLRPWLEAAAALDLVVETMYPGEWLGTGDELEVALDCGVRLAVDVSHLHIQRCQGAITDAQLRRLLAATAIEEIHVSANDGQRDRHFGVASDSYLIDWAAERVSDLPVVLESYWHRADEGERQAQLDLFRS